MTKRDELLHKLLSEALENLDADPGKARAAVELAVGELAVEEDRRFSVEPRGGKRSAAPVPELDPLQVKIELLKRDLTLRSWALANGWDQSTVWRAVHRGSRGYASRMIIQQLKEDLWL